MSDSPEKAAEPEEAKDEVPAPSSNANETKPRYNGAPKSFWNPKLPMCSNLEEQLD